LREENAELLALQWGGPSVDLNDDVAVASKADLVGLIDFDERNVAQDIDRSSARGRRHVFDIVRIPIRRKLLFVTLGFDFLARELRCNAAELDGAEVDDGFVCGDDEIGSRYRRKSKRPEAERVSSWR
jgi:hypothetical protein